MRNTYIYPPEPSMKIIADIFEYTSQNILKFNSISISGYHMQEAGATPVLEMAYTLADGLEYVRTGIKAGMNVDDLRRDCHFLGNWNESFHGNCQNESCSLYLGKSLTQFNPQNQKSLALRTHSQTSGWSLTEQEPFNNITRTAIEALSSALGGTQSLHTNVLDEAIAFANRLFCKIMRNTQIILQQESGICDVVDPMGGSHLVEALTQQMIEEAQKIYRRSRTRRRNDEEQ